MKKRIALIFLFATIFTTQTYAAESGAINVSISGERIDFADQPPAIVDGRTLVPARAIFEHLGFEVLWSEETRSIILLKEEMRWCEETQDLIRAEDFFIIRIQIGEQEFTTNGRAFALDVPAQIIGGRTMLPIRALMESIGYFVDWEGATNTIHILNEPPQFSQITIPNRELTPEEIEIWTRNYHAMGGATEFEREVIRLTNIERVNAGLNPVEEDLTLMLASRFKAQSMYDLDYFSHTNVVYGHFANIARQVFNKPLRSMGENLGRDYPGPEEIVAAWMDSPSHRDNILTPNYTRIGVGIYNNRWVQKFSG